MLRLGFAPSMDLVQATSEKPEYGTYARDYTLVTCVSVLHGPVIGSLVGMSLWFDESQRMGKRLGRGPNPWQAVPR